MGETNVYAGRLRSNELDGWPPAVTALGSNGARGLASDFEGGKVTLIASTTATTANTIVVATDDLSGVALGVQ